LTELSPGSIENGDHDQKGPNVKKKSALILLFLFVSSFAYAREESDRWKAAHLEDERKRLSAEYEGKIKELSELTMKIHEIDVQLEELKAKPGQAHNPYR
jgi:hypothetical protein